MVLTVLVLAAVAAPGTAAATPGAGASYIEFPSLVFGDANVNGCPPANSAPQLNAPVVALAFTPDGGGYWQAAADGGVFTCGDAGFYGSAGALPLVAPVVAMAATPDGRGYWLAAADGGVFSYGDAGFYGSATTFPHAPIVSITLTPDGRGYWLAAADGGVFSFGDARFYGSAATFGLRRPVVGMARATDGNGYWLAAADGGVFAFGDARFDGSAATFSLAGRVTGIAATPDGGGYWLSGADAGVFSFGDAPFLGSRTSVPPWPDPVGGIAATPSGHGYALFLSPPHIEPGVPGMSGFDLARLNYLGSYYYADSFTNLFLDQAALFLQLGAQLDSGDRAGYAAAIAELQQVAALPASMVDPAQAQQLTLLTAQLDAFFGIPDNAPG